MRLCFGYIDAPTFFLTLVILILLKFFVLLFANLAF